MLDACANPDTQMERALFRLHYGVVFTDKHLAKLLKRHMRDALVRLPERNITRVGIPAQQQRCQWRCAVDEEYRRYPPALIGM